MGTHGERLAWTVHERPGSVPLMTYCVRDQKGRRKAKYIPKDEEKKLTAGGQEVGWSVS